MTMSAADVMSWKLNVTMSAADVTSCNLSVMIYAGESDLALCDFDKLSLDVAVMLFDVALTF